ncbi:MAG: DUF169 domain-containing protein [Candidatus Heimdallarchaeota archaeon]|nr:MAG: DUF169 domain-containing protein [Candidatus Heimdallarchaeota archaeon]
MDNWMEIGKSLEEILRPQTYPLAIKFVKDESEFPERTRRPEEKIAICQALSICRKYGWTMGITGEDSGCPGASVTYGWPSPIDESQLAQFFQIAGYASDEIGTQRIVENLDRLEAGKYGGVVVSPLTRTKIVPDVILVYGNPAQIMRLLQGNMYKEGKKLKSELAGIMASCTAGIIRTFNTHECQVVVPGNGDRVFAGTQDNEMLFTIPPEKAEDIIDGMRQQRFAKYPIPATLQMPPPFPL